MTSILVRQGRCQRHGHPGEGDQAAGRQQLRLQPQDLLQRHRTPHRRCRQPLPGAKR
jgi:hypothetical protein